MVRTESEASRSVRRISDQGGVYGRSSNRPGRRAGTGRIASVTERGVTNV
jgi:hypothetical protein